jgi:hypothetical protein
MPWPLPDPAELFERAVAELEATFGAEAIDPRAPESVLGAIARITAMAAFEQHLYLSYQAAACAAPRRSRGAAPCRAWARWPWRRAGAAPARWAWC